MSKKKQEKIIDSLLAQKLFAEMELSASEESHRKTLDELRIARNEVKEIKSSYEAEIDVYSRSYYETLKKLRECEKRQLATMTFGQIVLAGIKKLVGGTK